jgi:hypothetical protein
VGPGCTGRPDHEEGSRARGPRFEDPSAATVKSPIRLRRGTALPMRQVARSATESESK